MCVCCLTRDVCIYDVSSLSQHQWRWRYRWCFASVVAQALLPKAIKIQRGEANECRRLTDWTRRGVMKWEDQWVGAHAETRGRLLQTCFLDVWALSERDEGSTGFRSGSKPRALFLTKLEVRARNTRTCLLFVSSHLADYFLVMFQSDLLIKQANVSRCLTLPAAVLQFQLSKLCETHKCVSIVHTQFIQQWCHQGRVLARNLIMSLLKCWNSIFQ